MRKILLICILITSSTTAFALEDCMIVSREPVKSVSVQNQELLSITPVFTINNEKKLLILKAKKIGKTKIDIVLNNSKKVLEINVKNDTTEIKPQEGFEYFTMDTPPEEINIPKPPNYGGDN